jgi:hypothetical protein
MRPYFLGNLHRATIIFWINEAASARRSFAI